VARDWPGLMSDAEARLHLYPRSVADAVVRLGQLSLWHPIPPEATLRRYRGLADARPDAEIAKTYYNSAIRRLLGTVGVDHPSEFLDLAEPQLDEGEVAPEIALPDQLSLEGALRETLERLGFGSAWADLGAQARAIAGRIAEELPEIARGARLAALPQPFIRNRRAFLVGRLTTERGPTPLVVALVHGDGGLVVDAVLLTPDEASVVFGFTRSYFLVELEAPRQVVALLRPLLPAKRIDEIYTVLGYHKHGKREFYQGLKRMLADPEVRFEPAEGTRGMVMVVFALKPLNAVFKVIRDRSIPPKQTTRKGVMERYRFVFHQEHGGRLTDAQEFEGITLPAAAFEPSVRDELLADARETVRQRADELLFSHLYTERRMTPLDAYLRSAAPAEARSAVVDFGRAIKELAGINVFPGDMLAKNFGVTRHGRVVFYDYDEICSLDAVTFRTMPPPRDDDDVLAAEPWFPVREGDVFPEEFERFLRFGDGLHQYFVQHHADLFTTTYWTAAQDRARRELAEPAPYAEERRLRR